LTPEWLHNANYKFNLLDGKVEKLTAEKKSLEDENESLQGEIDELKAEIEYDEELHDDDESTLIEMEREAEVTAERCLSNEREGIMFRGQRDKV
jgi:peptidoglycan hydrolase CwlO-like protein